MLKLCMNIAERLSMIVPDVKNIRLKFIQYTYLSSSNLRVSSEINIIHMIGEMMMIFK